MRETFTPKNFGPSAREVIDTAITICEDMSAQGYELTLRQLYYQFVAHHGLPNRQQSYKRLGTIINDARLAGLMDWDHISDRTREVRGGFGGWDSPATFIRRHAEYYSESIWVGQQYRPEVWVEKDALVDVVSQACSDTRTPYFSCRGYVSQSEMYAAAKRIEARRDRGHQPVVIHLGDHDPSGLDMTRDIRDRLEMMSWGDVPVLRIALNMDQVEQYSPPPNPAKITDSRAQGYIDEFGYESWELDALTPAVLDRLIQDTLADYIDADLMAERVEHERETTDRMVEIADRWDDLDDRWDDVEQVLDR